MHLTMMSVGASCEVKAKQQLVLFCFVLFVTATDLSKDLTDKIRTEGSSRKASKGGLLKGKSKRKAKHSRKVQFERSGAQVRYEEEQPGSQKANTKGAQSIP